MNSKAYEVLEGIINKSLDTGTNPTVEEATEFLKSTQVDWSNIISISKAYLVSPLLVIRAGFPEFTEHIDDNMANLNTMDSAANVDSITLNSKLIYGMERISQGDYNFLEDEVLRYLILYTVFGYYADLNFEATGHRTEEFIQNRLEEILNWEEEVAKPQVIHRDKRQLYVEDGKIKARTVQGPEEEVYQPKVVPNMVNGYFGYHNKYLVNTYRALFSKFTSKTEARNYIYSTF